MEANPSHRRRERVRQVFLAFLDHAGIRHEREEGGLVNVHLPAPDTEGEIEWRVAFEADVAETREADLVDFTDPRFQRILREVGSGPLVVYRLAHDHDHPPLEAYLGPEASLPRTDFAFHIEYSTSGLQREELWRTEVETSPIDGRFLTDALAPESLELPPEFDEHAEEARDRLRAHLLDRVRGFAADTRDRWDEEEARLEGYRDSEGFGAGRVTENMREADAFYEDAVEAFRSRLEEKYEVRVRVRLLTVRAYLSSPSLPSDPEAPPSP